MSKHASSNGEFDSLTSIVVLSLVFGIAAFGTDMYLPAFPAIRETFDTQARNVQWSLSLFLYGNAAGHLVFGPLSDRFGRKPILLLGLAAYALASVGCALAPSMSIFLAMRLLQGAASASAPVLVRALINDRMARDRAAQTLALLTGLMALAAMITPTIGGWLVENTGWRWIFFGLGGLAIMLFVTSAHNVTETLPPSRRVKSTSLRSVGKVYIDIVANRQFWCYAAPPSLMFASVFAYAAVNSFLLIDELGMTESLYGMSYSFAALSYVAGSLTSNRLVRHVGIDRAIVLGLALGSTTAALAVVATAILPMSIALVLIPGLCAFFATSLILPIGFSMAVSLFPEHGGSASAVVGCAQIGLAGIGSAFAAMIHNDTTMPLHLFTLGCSLAAALIWYAGRNLRHRLVEAT